MFLNSSSLMSRSLIINDHPNNRRWKVKNIQLQILIKSVININTPNYTRTFYGNFDVPVFYTLKFSPTKYMTYVWWDLPPCLPASVTNFPYILPQNNTLLQILAITKLKLYNSIRIKHIRFKLVTESSNSTAGVGIAMGYRLEGRSLIPGTGEVSLYSIASRPTLWPMQFPIRWVTLATNPI
jgi:hypothetical protein